jgi:PPOX class probable F420-dependent enzyme
MIVETVSTPTNINLDDYKFISLATFRKNGSRVATPVTFASHNGRLYVVTGVKSGKIKRLRHTNQVELSSCDSRGAILGPTICGWARILSDEEAVSFKPHLRFKAGNLFMFFFNRLRDLRQGGNIYLEITVEA